MELFVLPSSATSIIIASLISIVVLTKVFIDFKEIRRSHRIYNNLLSQGKKHSNKSVSVLINLDRATSSILPLLDNLYSQNYKKLEVIVTVRPSAGKNAKRVLEDYSQRNQISKLAIVNRTKGVTTQDIIKYYTNGSIVILLDKDDRLYKDFFSDISLDFINDKDMIVQPMNYVALNRTIASGIKAHFSIWHKLFSRINNPNRQINVLQPGYAYRRNVLLKDINNPKILLARSAYITSNDTSLRLSTYASFTVNKIADRFNNFYVVLASILILAVLIITGSLASSDELILTSSTLFILYVVVSTFSSLGTKGYTFIDYLNLVLLAPLGMIFGILIVAYIWLRSIVYILIGRKPIKS